MKQVELIFPDNKAMADFVLKEKINSAEVNSQEQLLTAEMPDDIIVAAETIYGAILKKMILKN